MASLLPLLSLLLGTASAAGLDDTSLPAAGTASTVLHTDTFGRWSIQASSESGTAIHTVDRMTGPGRSSGVPGKDDGRLDLFVEKGELKVVTTGVSGAKGSVELTAVPYQELNRTPTQLVPTREVVTTLQDTEQRSWWIVNDTPRRVNLVSSGRYLDTVRFWQDGEWLHDAMPSCETITPNEGQPWRRCTMSVDLPVGSWRVTAYGGAGQPWAEAGEVAPLTMQWELPRLPSTGRIPITLGPTGEAAFRVKGARKVSAELPRLGRLQLGVASESSPWSVSMQTLSNDARQPILSTSMGGSEQVVHVRGAPGAKVTVQTLTPTSRTVQLRGNGHARYLATVTSGAAGDTAPTTAVVSLKDESIDERLLMLDPSKRIEDTFNLDGRVELYVRTKHPGTYRFEVTGTEATVQVMPFFVHTPRDFKPEEPQEGAVEKDLNNTIYRLILTPKHGGVATLKITPSTWSSWAKGLVGVDEQAIPALERPGLRWDHLKLGLDETVTLHLGRPSDGDLGLADISLPADLSNGLPIPLAPGESMTLPVIVPSKGRIKVVDDRGNPLELRTRSSAWSPDLTVDISQFDMSVRNSTDTPVQAVVLFEAWEVLPDVPLPTLAALRERPSLSLPTLKAGAPVFLDMSASTPGAWAVNVEKPALYTVHTTGLLNTQGTMRSRVRTSLAQASSNGAGRNFEVSRYLGSGEYILRAETLGSSSGHLGVHLSTQALREGGMLRPEDTARTTLKASEALHIRLEAPTEGTYRVDVLSVSSEARCRFEDDDGWPLMDPDVSCSRTLRLPAGTTHMTLLPDPLGGRRVVRFTEVVAPPTFTGHGPHDLPREQEITHTWREPAVGEERTPDVWTVQWPATTTAHVDLPDTMVGVLHNAAGEVVARTVPGESWSGELTAGTYTLHTRALRRDDRLSYTVKMWASALVDGSSRTVSLPATLTLAVSRATPVVVETFGTTDVRATLDTGLGSVRVDDAPDDWNARIVTRVTPGNHTLRLEAVDGRGRTTVSVRVPAERTDAPLSTAELRSVAPGRDAVILPLDIPRRGELIEVSARSDQAVGVALEAQGPDGWTVVDEQVGRAPVLAARRRNNTDLRLRVWTLDGRPDPVELEVFLPEGRAARENALASGVKARSRRDAPLEGKAAVWRVSGAGVRVCASPGAACTVVDTPTIAVDGDLWLLTPSHAVASRLVVDATPAPVPLPADRSVALDLAHDSLSLLQIEGGLSPVDAPGSLRTVSGATTWALEEGNRRVLSTHTRAMVRVSARPLAPQQAEALTWGVHSVEVPAGTSLRVDLPRKRSRNLSVALPKGLGVVVTTADGQERLVGAIHAARTVEVFGADESVRLINPTSAPMLVSVSVIPGGEAPQLTGGSPFEAAMPGAGTLVLPVLDGGPLHLSGGTGIFLGDVGDIHTTNDFRASAGGVWLIDHAPGDLHAWLGEAPTRSDKPGGQHLITGSDRVALSGTRTDLQFRLNGPSLVRWTAPVPAVLTAEAHALGATTTSVTAAEPFDLWLPTGQGTLSARALGERVLGGDASLTVVTSRAAGEGLGPEAVVAPGAPAVYHFDVTRSGRVGIGVSAAADGVRTRLLTDTGAVLAEGSAAMPTLEPGRYWLVLDVSPSATPVRARPALVGLDQPPTDPPAQVVQRYLALAGLTPEDAP